MSARPEFSLSYAFDPKLDRIGLTYGAATFFGKRLARLNTLGVVWYTNASACALAVIGWILARWAFPQYVSIPVGALSAVIAGTLLTVALISWRARILKRAVRRLRFYDGEMRVQLSDEGISASAADSRVSLRWSGVKHVYRFRGGVSVLGRDATIVIPETAMSRSSEWERLLLQIEEWREAAQ